MGCDGGPDFSYQILYFFYTDTCLEIFMLILDTDVINIPCISSELAVYCPRGDESEREQQ